MAKYLPLPDGSTLKVPNSMSYDEAMGLAEKQFPDLFQASAGEGPKGGFTPALKAGVAGLKGDVAALLGRTGIMDADKAEAYKAEQEKIAKQTFKPTEEGWTEAPVTKVKELLGGSLPYMAAPLAAGAAAASAPVSATLGVSGALLGAGAAGLTSAAQFTGTNLGRQMEEGKKLSETDLGSAALAAIPQAALDTVSMRMIPGIGRVLGKAGTKVTPEMAQGIAEQGLKKTLADYAVSTGKTAGVEGLTEAAQQFLERWQAGLNLTDDKARKEYWDNLVGGAVLGGVLSPAGRFVERGQEKAEARGVLAAEDQRKAEEAAKAEEARTSSPDYLRGLNQQFEQARTQMEALHRAATKPGKDATPEQMAAYEQAKTDRAEFLNGTFKPLKDEYDQRKGQISQMLAQQAEQESQRMAGIEAGAATMPQPTAAAPVPNAPPRVDVNKLMGEHTQMRGQMDEVTTALQAAANEGDTAKINELMPQYTQLKQTLDDRAQLIEQHGGVATSLDEFVRDSNAKMQKVSGDLKATQAALTKASDLGEFDKLPKLAEKLDALKKEREVLSQDIETRKAKYDFATLPQGTTNEMFGQSDTSEEAKQRASEVLKAEEERGLYGPESQKEGTKKTFAETGIGPRGQLEAAPAETLTPEERTEADKFVEDIFSLENRVRNAKQDVTPEAAARQEEQHRLEVMQGSQAPAGTRRTRKPIMHELFTDKERARFTNGTNNSIIYDENGDKVRLQDLYDKGGDQLVEHEVVMAKVRDAKKAVTTKQRNAGKPLLQELYDTAADLEKLYTQRTSGVATPTMREQVAGAQAKLGKGAAPAERQMDASEKYQLERKIKGLENKYNMVFAKVAAVRDQVLKLQDSLYETTPVASAKTAKAEKETRSRAEGSGPKAMTRSAATAARFERGEHTKEAHETQAMRELAQSLGKQEPAYETAKKDMARRLKALYDKYGKEDPKSREYLEYAQVELKSLASKLGMATPEYKATLKEQVEYLKEVYASAGKQEIKSKHIKGPVTKKAVAAPREMPTSSPESRARSAQLHQYLQDAKEALDREREEGVYGDGNWRSDGKGGIDLDAAQERIDKLKLPEGVKFKYVPTLDKAPIKFFKEAAAQNLTPQQLSTKKGVVLNDGTVIIIGEAHADLKDLEQTIAHELIGHYGVEGLLGDKGMTELYGKVVTQEGGLLKLADDLGVGAEVRSAIAEAKENGIDAETADKMGFKEMLAYAEEQRPTESFVKKAGRLVKELVGAIRQAFKRMGLTELSTVDTNDIYKILRDARKKFNEGRAGAARGPDGGLLFRSSKITDPRLKAMVAEEASLADKVKANFFGLGARQQFVDAYASIDKAITKGVEKKVLTSLEASQAMYYLRFGEQRSQYVSQFVTNGPVELKANKTAEGIEYLFKSKPGATLMKVAELVGTAGFGNDATAEAAFTAYVAGERAKQVGWEKLNTDVTKGKEAYAAVMAKLNSDPKAKGAFEAALKEYQKYNNGLIDFVVQCGAMAKTEGDRLKSYTYVPFYRVKDGMVELVVDSEHIVKIGSMKNQPNLKELLGDNNKIMPIYSSAMQNTAMLTDMALRNIKTKNTAFALQKLGFASKFGNGIGPTGPDTVRFKERGQPKFIVIDKDALGIPADLVVKSMEGITTTIPAVVRLMGVPADLLRKFVTRNPAYALRQAIRDPLSAWLTTGTDAMPVVSTLKELSKMVAGRSLAEADLMASGAISSNVFTGDSRDMSRFLREIQTGKSGWDTLVAKADAFALQGDSATRAVIYTESLRKGMTEMQALMRTLESMNFSRRGLSPSMQVLSTVIPFFNAQIQGIDVLYRAARGEMPFSERLDVQKKMLQRGLLLSATAIAYAMLMQDDETYKNARPEERYGNFFVPIPGSEESLRVPLPFELGYIFKALPEAAFNTAFGDEKAENALKGIGKLFAQSNPFGLPQAIKPATEVILGKSFYTGGDIESAREKQALPAERYREGTSELAKLIGSVTGEVGLSPIKLEYLVRGYTGGLGVALTQVLNPLLKDPAPNGAEVEKPTTKLSQMPMIGSLFQPADGRGFVDEAYQRMDEIRQAKGTYNKMVEQGRTADARAFVQKYANDLALMPISGGLQKQLGELAKRERQIIASPNLTTEQKDAQIKVLREAQIKLARSFVKAAEPE